METVFSTSSPLKKIAYEEKLFKEIGIEAYASKMMGNSEDSIIQVKTNLEKDQGHDIEFGLIPRLTGDGVTGDEVLENKEEGLQVFDYKLTLEQYRHAVLDKGAYQRKAFMFSIDEASKNAIKIWGSEKVDKLAFEAWFPTSPTGSATVYFYVQPDASPLFTTTYATAKSAISSDDADSKLSMKHINIVKTFAKNGGSGDIQKIRPVKIDGKPHYVLLCHDDCLYDLKQTTDFKDAMHLAEVRGKDNPLFSGATAVFDGVIIHTHELCPIGTDAGGGTIPYGRAKLLGAQSLLWAWGARGELIEGKRDWDNKHGFAYRLICKAAKPVFNGKDFGSIELVLGRTKISDAL